MATKCSTDCTESINQQSSVTSQPEQHTPQPDYDFVDQPDQDYFCPVSLELLTQPHQTTCCGNHISQQAADKLINEQKPCPLCKKDNFGTNEDLYFTRKIRQLKVYCFQKKNGCKWTGEVGDLSQHTTSCPKRPWKCPYCNLESTYDIGTTGHAPQCDYQLVPCLNHCQVGTVPRYHVEKHLLTCPLQLVDCEFANAGCDVRVPRKDMAGHMTESAQHHLMTATLLNLQLTKDLHQKMEEKDQQIVQLQTQLKQQGDQLQHLVTQFQKIKIDREFQQLEAKVNTKIGEINTVVKASKNALQHHLFLLRGFTCHEITLTEFTQWQEKGGTGRWESTPFSNTSNGHKFTMIVHTNGTLDAKGTHLSAFIEKKHNSSKTEGIVILQLLNQTGEQGHFTGIETQLQKVYISICLGQKFFPLTNILNSNDSNTQYLKDNCLKFRLFLKVN